MLCLGRGDGRSGKSIDSVRRRDICIDVRVDDLRLAGRVGVCPAEDRKESIHLILARLLLRDLMVKYICTSKK